jgi:hypothetical protein
MATEPGGEIVSADFHAVECAIVIGAASPRHQ